MKHLTFAAGEPIMSSGQLGTSMYFMDSGKAPAQVEGVRQPHEEGARGAATPRFRLCSLPRPALSSLCATADMQWTRDGWAGYFVCGVGCGGGAGACRYIGADRSVIQLGGADAPVACMFCSKHAA